MKRYLGCICLLYIAIISYVYFSGYLDNFLAPNMQWYIIVSVVILIPISLTLLINNNLSYKFKISDLLLILPIFMILAAGDGRLTTSLASNRSNNIVIDLQEVNTEETIIEEQPIEIIEEETIEEKSLDKIDFEVVDEAYSYLANLMMTTKNIDKFIGKTIKFRGFTMTNSNTLPKGYFAIGKYEITCCAADAGFTGWIVRSTKTFENDKWYEVEGIIEKVSINNNDFISVNIINAKEIDGSKETLYVYPCFSYDNGNCAVLKNYDLS